MPSTGRDLPVMAFELQDAWARWLAEHGDASKGVRLKLARKASGLASVSRQDAIETALCYGWIDGRLDKFDENCWLVRFTPRGPRSKWSQTNRTTALRLIEQGRMQPAGLRQIERARADGRWDAAYAPQSKATVPDDLQAALDANGLAKRLFDELDSRNRYAILHRIHDARKPETRARRIETFVSMLARGETLYPRRGKR